MAIPLPEVFKLSCILLPAWQTTVMFRDCLLSPIIHKPPDCPASPQTDVFTSCYLYLADHTGVSADDGSAPCTRCHKVSASGAGDEEVYFCKDRKATASSSQAAGVCEARPTLRPGKCVAWSSQPPLIVILTALDSSACPHQGHNPCIAAHLSRLMVEEVRASVKQCQASLFQRCWG